MLPVLITQNKPNRLEIIADICTIVRLFFIHYGFRDSFWAE